MNIAKRLCCQQSTKFLLKNTRILNNCNKKLFKYPELNNGFFIYRAVITRPKEMDVMRSQSVLKVKKKVRDDSSGEDIDLWSIFLLSFPVVSFALGTWQIKRRQEKLNLIQSLEDRLYREPIEMPENLEDLKNMEYCPVKVKGEFLYDKEFIIGPRSLLVDGRSTTEHKGNLISGGGANKGYNIITPFKLENRDTIILINRGWVPNQYKKPELRKKLQVHGPVELIGTVRLNETRPQFVMKNEPDKNVWNYRDIYQMANYAGTEPVFLDLRNSDSQSKIIHEGQTRVNLRNEHLSYIITWYGLALATGFYWFRIYILKRPIF